MILVPWVFFLFDLCFCCNFVFCLLWLVLGFPLSLGFCISALLIKARLLFPYTASCVLSAFGSSPCFPPVIVTILDLGHTLRSSLECLAAWPFFNGQYLIRHFCHSGSLHQNKTKDVCRELCGESRATAAVQGRPSLIDQPACDNDLLSTLLLRAALNISVSFATLF